MGPEGGKVVESTCKYKARLPKVDPRWVQPFLGPSIAWSILAPSFPFYVVNTQHHDS